MKRTVLYIIDSLAGIGGAELILAASLKDIHCSYNTIVVTLYPGNVFKEMHLVCDKEYCLQMKSRKDIIIAAKKLKKIIYENEVTFVHSILYWSTVIARVACGKTIPLIFQLTSMQTEHIYKYKWYSRYTQLIDKLTYKKNHVVIAPTKAVLQDFDRSIGIKGESKIIYNFVLDDFFKNQIEYIYPSNELKFVAVGNIKEVKNYQVIIDAFQLLTHIPVSIDIYGFGNFTDVQQKKINEYNLPIRQMGSKENIYQILPKYDAFIMSSFLEGFGISAAEAMAIGLPLLLSDIKVLKEVSDGNALFFDPYNAKTLAGVITAIFENKADLKTLSEKGKAIAVKKYTRHKYISDVLDLYKGVESKNNS